MTKFGSIETFTGGSWCIWAERLEFFFVANRIDDPIQQRALLLTLCGPETFEIARGIVSPRTPAEVSLAELVAALGIHFDSKPSEVYNRCNFQQRNQLPDESLADYAAALKKLAEVCNFELTATAAAPGQEIGYCTGEHVSVTEYMNASPKNTTTLPMDIMLRDRFVCGINDQTLKQRLFAERDLTFQKAFDMGVQAEMMTNDQRSMKTETVVHASYEPSWSDRSHERGRRGKCFCCDGHHDPNPYRYQSSNSAYCNGRGGIRGTCCIKKQNDQPWNDTRAQEHEVAAPIGDAESWELDDAAY